MDRSGALRTIGKISAIATFIENFPMSVLDVMNGPVYNSVFDFLIDALKSCNIDIYYIAERILITVFGVDIDISKSADSVYSAIEDLDADKQSQFLEILESSIKWVLLSLITSIFSCSAKPVLPAKYMDSSNKYFGNTIANSQIIGGNIFVPYWALNAFGQMDISPFSKEGKLYYPIKSKDRYYKLIHRSELINEPGQTIQTTTYKKAISVGVKLGPGHDDYLSKHMLFSEDELQFAISEALPFDLKIKVNYTTSDNEDKEWEGEIPAGKLNSEIFLITPHNLPYQDITDQQAEDFVQYEYINSIKIGKDTTDDTCFSTGSGDGEVFVYLSKYASLAAIDYWDDVGNFSLSDIKWSSIAEAPTSPQIITPGRTIEIDEYYYEEIDEPVSGATRVSEVPEKELNNESSPEYIVWFDSVDSSNAYKTTDMNTFLWYVYNLGDSMTQQEINKCMWDSRRQAAGYNVIRQSAADWNKWYNSKSNPFDQLEYEGDNTDKLFPIVQLEPQNDGIRVVFPSQTYYKPNYTQEDSPVRAMLRLNSTIYKFNYDYLNSIKILNPKVILFKMFDYLLNGAISAFLSVRVNRTREETMTKLSTAIKKYIEAEDTEIEDCYFSFSNEEFDSLLRDMMLSKYNATYSGGEAHKAVEHDIESYVSKIDLINPAATQDGATSKIMKLITDVSVTGGKEGTITHGIELSGDERFWKRLIWAIAMPIIESIFSPQVLMLLVINFEIMGITSTENLLGGYQSEIVRLIINKVFSLVGTIISLIKDKIAMILINLFKEEILPIISQYMLIRLRERMQAWISYLNQALGCLTMVDFRRRPEVSEIDDVNYADIIKEQKIPENQSNC